jgi:4-amino-4-deoxy-L-arabinose transferase-like glycosyltransferase
LALLCLLTCLYWLTARAHIDIQDPETIYLVTEALVERGTFAQLEPEQAGNAPRAVVRARDGNLYAITGPLQSLLSVPFYLVGSWVGRAFPPPFYGYFTRFFVCLLNGLVHAATVAVLYLFGIDLGYRRRTSLFVALAYGLATVAWPYARTAFSETLLAFWLILAAWAAYCYVRTDRWGWMALLGVAVAAGVASKYVMAVAGPIFALYLLLHFWPRDDWRARWRWAGRTILAGGIPFALIIGALMAFNYARFGSLLETGYTNGPPTSAINTWTKKATFLPSLYSFFFSSGKGFFFFSPPTVLALWGVPALVRRRRNVTWLLLAVAAAYPLFYSAVHRWHGGANWGPRYIVCITPFLVLPVGAFLERSDLTRWWRVGSATVLFVLGCWIQMSTIFVGYSTYVFSDVPFQQQLYSPADSTLAAQWRLWPRQVAAWQDYDHDLRSSDAQFYVIDGGFYDTEVPDLAPFGRWMRERGRLYIYARPEQAVQIEIAYSRSRLADPQAADWAGLRLVYDGAPVSSERRLIAELDHETQWIETLTIPAADVHVWPGKLEITAPVWKPQQFNDARGVSVFVGRVNVWSDQEPLAFREANLPRPMPVSTAYPWSWEAMRWFYAPYNARPFDVWPWHVWASGAPLPQARTFILIMLIVLGGGLVASTGWLILAIKRGW